MRDRLLEAIEASDTDELLRIVDALCGRRAWDELADLRIRCREAVTRGKQLWSIDEHVRYRLALEAPGPIAGAAVAEGPARFALGPITEVAASTHGWAELEPHLPSGPARALVAHERAIRGEDLTGADFDSRVLELPPALRAWEPRYPLAVYRSDRGDFPTPPAPGWEPAILDVEAPAADEHDAGEALARLVEAWTGESNGHAETAVVEGGALAAIRRLGPSRALVAEVGAADALAWMGWAAAAGGAHGRRRGAAAGRFAAWWAATALAGLPWPVDPDELGEAIADLRWHLWSDLGASGWWLGLAVEDPVDGLAWALAASDEAT
ncbi:MAG: hypothetical protein R6X29_02650 [Acidimicrobiia bacterium]|jgi:hypothetical protein